MRVTTIAALALLLAACTEDESETPVGEWRGVGALNLQNVLSVVDDGSGKATLFINFTDMGQVAAGRFEFDAEWIDRDASFEFDMRCTRSPFGACMGDDFDMSCEIAQEGATMPCRGTNNWSEYDLSSWTRVSGP